MVSAAAQRCETIRPMIDGRDGAGAVGCTTPRAALAGTEFRSPHPETSIRPCKTERVRKDSPFRTGPIAPLNPPHRPPPAR